MDKKVLEVIDSEVDFAKGWDELSRDERPLKDSEKPVEFWIMHIQNYLDKARKSCYGVDKTDALENIRKAAGLCVQYMEHNPTPKRSNTRCS